MKKKPIFKLVAFMVAVFLIAPASVSAGSTDEKAEFVLAKVMEDPLGGFPVDRTGGIAYNGEFVLYFPYGTLDGFRSYDGIHWQLIEAKREIDGFLYDGLGITVKKMIWDGTRFVAITDMELLTSEDGLLWKSQSIEHPDSSLEYVFMDIIHTGDAYVLVAYERPVHIGTLYVPGPNTFLVSKDLVTFEAGTKRNMVKSVFGERLIEFLATNGTVIFAGGNGTAVSDDGGRNWAGVHLSIDDAGRTNGPYAGSNAIWDGRQFVHAYGNVISTSKDGKNWELHEMAVAGDAANINVDSIAFNGVEYIAFGYNDAADHAITIYQSYDLNRWNQISVPDANAKIRRAMPFENGFILIGTDVWHYQNHSANVPSNWAEADIQQAKANRLASDKLLGAYRKLITRAEFAEICVRLYEGLTGEEARVEHRNSPFTDTKNEFVIKANQLGLVSGKGNGKFAPDEPLQRQDMAVMLENVLRKANIPMDRSQAEWQQPYADLDHVSAYAVNSLKYFNSEGLILGADDAIQPKQNATREQALVIAQRVFNKFGERSDSRPG